MSDNGVLRIGTVGFDQKPRAKRVALILTRDPLNPIRSQRATN
jgi:hypothetical protein